MAVIGRILNDPPPPPERREKTEHDLLVERAYKWLLNVKGCSFAFRELRAFTREIPDAIGWKDGHSVLIECKSNRADFLSDRDKIFRKVPKLGMGRLRFFLCPPGMIEIGELRHYFPGWGLLHCHPKQIRMLLGPAPHIEYNKDAEIVLMNSALRRVHLRGDLEKIYTLEPQDG